MAGVQAAVFGRVFVQAVPLGAETFFELDFAVPMALGLLFVALLHANNVRDVLADRKANVRTVANLLPPRGRALYFAALFGGAYALLLACASRYSEPRLAIAAVVALPWALTLMRRVSRNADRTEALRWVPQSVGQHNTLLSVFVVLALVPEAFAARCALASLFAMGGINNFLSLSYVSRLCQAKLSGLVGARVPFALATAALVGASTLQIGAAVVILGFLVFSFF